MTMKAYAAGYANQNCCAQAAEFGVLTTIGTILAKRVLATGTTRAFCHAALITFTADHLITQYGTSEQLAPGACCWRAIAAWVGTCAGTGWLLDCDPYASGVLFGALPLFACNRFLWRECTGELLQLVGEAEAERERLDPTLNNLRVLGAQASITSRMYGIIRQEGDFQRRAIPHPHARQIAQVRALQDRNTNFMSPEALAAHADAMEAAPALLRAAFAAGEQALEQSREQAIDKLQSWGQAVQQRQERFDALIQYPPDWVTEFAAILPKEMLQQEWNREVALKQQIGQELEQQNVYCQAAAATAMFGTTDEERFGHFRAFAQFLDEKMAQIQQGRAATRERLGRLAG